MALRWETAATRMQAGRQAGLQTRGLLVWAPAKPEDRTDTVWEPAKPGRKRRGVSGYGEAPAETAEIHTHAGTSGAGADRRAPA